MAINGSDVQGMVTHWLGCPPNGYLGSGYGSAVQDLLQTPQSGPAADSLIRKVRQDIPIVGNLDGSSVNVYAKTAGADGLDLFFEVAGNLVPIPNPAQSA